MGRGWWYKTLWETAPSEVPYFSEKEVVSRIWGLEINHLNAHNFVWQGCFLLSFLSRNFDDWLSSNFHRLVILCVCWDTPTVKAILWQLPIVSTAFKLSIELQINMVLFFYKRQQWAKLEISACAVTRIKLKVLLGKLTYQWSMIPSYFLGFSLWKFKLFNRLLVRPLDDAQKVIWR